MYDLWIFLQTHDYANHYAKEQEQAKILNVQVNFFFSLFLSNIIFYSTSNSDFSFSIS